MKKLLLTATCLFLFLSHAFAANYSIIDLGVGVIPMNINNNGYVVGFQYNNGAFIYKDGSFTSLGDGNAYGINNAVKVVGTIGSYAALWENGTSANLGNLGTGNSYAWSINNSSQIVGKSYTSVASGLFGFHAALWDNGTVKDLGTLGGYSSNATDINDSGQIVGYSNSSYDYPLNYGFLYENGRMVKLSWTGSSNATSINNNGQIVGYGSYDNGTKYMAAIWNNGLSDGLGTLGGTDSFAMDINNFGQAIGYSATGHGLDHGFLWQNGTMTDLNDFVGGTGWELWNASAINDSGFIVGRGRINGADHGYLLAYDDSQPVPEPSTLLLLGAGLGGLALLRKRKQ